LEEDNLLRVESRNGIRRHTGANSTRNSSTGKCNVLSMKYFHGNNNQAETNIDLDGSKAVYCCDVIIL